MAREFAMLVTESSYGTPKTSPVIGTDAFIPRLHESDTFTAQMTPVQVDIPYGGGWNTPADMVEDQFTCEFDFKTYLYPGAYSAMLLNWALTPVNAGRTTPWTTTDPNNLEPTGDLASLSFYHAYMRDDGTYDRRRYGGAKCTTWSITASRQSPVWMFTCKGTAARDDLNGAGTVAYPTSTEFPAPTETQYPLGPYVFSHVAGTWQAINTGSSMRSQYESLTLSGTNVMDANFWENRYVQNIRFLGRTVSLSSSIRMKATPDDLAFFQTATALKTSFTITNGTNSLAFNLGSKNYLKGVARSLAINKDYRRTINIQNFWDPVAAGDLTFTAT